MHKTHLVRSSNSERKGSYRGVIQKGESHERNPCASKFEERTLEGTSRQEEYARKAAWNLARKNYKLKAKDKATFYSLVEIEALVQVSNNTEERMIVVDSGASMQMLSKKDLSSDEMDTLRRSRNPSTVVTANGEVQTNEESHVYVHDLDLFVTMQLLEETPAVLSLGELCSEHGCSDEWKNGETSRLTKNVKTISCIMDNFVLLVVPGLSSSSSSSSASTSRPKDQSKYSGEPEASTDTMTTRRAKHARGKPMQTNSDKQASESRGLAHTEDEMDEEDPKQGIPDWLQPFIVRYSGGKPAGPWNSQEEIIEKPFTSMENMAIFTCFTGLFMPRTSSVSTGQSQKVVWTEIRGSKPKQTRKCSQDVTRNSNRTGRSLVIG